MSQGSQSSLGAFGTGLEHPANEVSASDGESAPETDSEQTASKPLGASALESLYETVKEVFKDEYPDSLKTLDSFIDLEPQRDIYITSGLPEEIDAVPHRIGAWELDFTDETNVTYRATGRAFDERWGDAAAIIRHRIHKNNHGIDATGKWVLRTQTCTGFGNPKMVRNASTDDSWSLAGIRGHSPRENSGDRGYSSGTKRKYDTAEEAVAGLIARLHVDRQPLHRELPTDGEALNGWNIKRYGTRIARWTRRTPIDNDFDEMQLSATGERVKLLLYNDGDRVADQKPFPIPVPEDSPENCVTQAHNQTNIEAPIVMPPIVHHVLSYSPGELIDAAHAAVQE